MALSGITSIDACGMPKCGWPTNIFAASSAEFAWTIWYSMMSLRASFTPAEDTTLGLPAPAPLSLNLLAFALIHLCHASIILASSGLRSCSGFFDHSSMTALGALYRTRNLSMVTSVVRCRLTPEVLVRERRVEELLRKRHQRARGKRKTQHASHAEHAFKQPPANRQVSSSERRVIDQRVVERARRVRLGVLPDEEHRPHHHLEQMQRDDRKDRQHEHSGCAEVSAPGLGPHHQTCAGADHVRHADSMDHERDGEQHAAPQDLVDPDDVIDVRLQELLQASPTVRHVVRGA